MNTFDRGCYGWKCVEAKDCKHHRRDAETMAQFFCKVFDADICPFFEEKSKPWGEGKEIND